MSPRIFDQVIKHLREHPNTPVVVGLGGLHLVGTSLYLADRRKEQEALKIQKAKEAHLLKQMESSFLKDLPLEERLRIEREYNLWLPSPETIAKIKAREEYDMLMRQVALLQENHEKEIEQHYNNFVKRFNKISNDNDFSGPDSPEL